MDELSKLILKFWELLFGGKLTNVLILPEPVYDIGEGIFLIMKILPQVADPIFELLHPFIIETSILDSNLCLEKSKGIQIPIFFIVIL